MPYSIPHIHSKPVSFAISASFRTFSSKRFIRVKGLNVCRVSISSTHKLSHLAHGILEDASHVLQSRVRQRYESIINGRYDKLQEGLWMMCTGNTMHGKKIVRSWARRRVAQAVRQELSARGFDDKGRKIKTGDASEGQKEKGGDRGPDVLVGTVDVEVLKTSVDLGFIEVQKQAGYLVEEILRICGRQVHTTNQQPSKQVLTHETQVQFKREPPLQS